MSSIFFIGFHPSFFILFIEADMNFSSYFLNNFFSILSDMLLLYFFLKISIILEILIKFEDPIL